MNTEVMFSSKSDEWETPQWLFDDLDKEFGFTLDVAATDENHKCKKYFTQEIDGLKQSWKGETCWMNPPYSQVALWLKKAHEEMMNGTTTVVLLPSRTDTKYFHSYIYNQPNVEYRFIKGRLKFSGSKTAAPFPSMLVIFNKNI